MTTQPKSVAVAIGTLAFVAFFVFVRHRHQRQGCLLRRGRGWSNVHPQWFADADGDLALRQGH